MYVPVIANQFACQDLQETSVWLILWHCAQHQDLVYAYPINSFIARISIGFNSLHGHETSIVNILYSHQSKSQFLIIPITIRGVNQDMNQENRSKFSPKNGSRERSTDQQQLNSVLRNSCHRIGTPPNLPYNGNILRTLFPLANLVVKSSSLWLHWLRGSFNITISRDSPLVPAFATSPLVCIHFELRVHKNS